MSFTSDMVSALANSETAPLSPPKERGWRCLDDGLSNFDGRVPAGLAEALQAGDCYCDYAAWDFHASVWWEGGKFRAYCLAYRRHVGTHEAGTLSDLMTECSDAHGHD